MRLRRSAFQHGVLCDLNLNAKNYEEKNLLYQFLIHANVKLFYDRCHKVCGREEIMPDYMDFKFSEARCMPVILLLDTSGSMSADGNINVLNNAVREMLQDFAAQDTGNSVIKVAIFAFGPDARKILPLSAAHEALDTYEDMAARGGTPLGGALNLAKTMIEDKTIISSRDYRPTVVLVSDGEPNDNWKPALNDFISNGRSAKCSRLSMGIGALTRDAQVMLEQFAGDSESVFSARDSRDIKNFFKTVTISTISRTISSTPAAATRTDAYKDDDDEYDLPF